MIRDSELAPPPELLLGESKRLQVFRDIGSGRPEINLFIDQLDDPVLIDIEGPPLSESLGAPFSIEDLISRGGLFARIA